MGENKGIGFMSDGDAGEENYHSDSAISKSSLSAKPVRWMLKDTQRWLKFGYNLAEDHL